MPSSDPARRIRDIVENAELIMRHTNGVEFETFVNDEVLRAAVERWFQRLTEAASKLGEQAETLMPGQNWPGIRGLGNRLRHEYDTVSPSMLWAAIQDDLPGLHADCQSVLADWKSK